MGSIASLEPGSTTSLMCVPLSHRIVTRELVMEWAEHLLQVTSSLDLRRLILALLRRAAALPGRLVAELQRFRALLAQGEDPAANFTTWGWRFFSVLMLVLVLAQTAMPTAVYAKGFGSHAPSYGGGTYYGGRAYAPARSAPAWSRSGPIISQPRPQQRSGYVSTEARGTHDGPVPLPPLLIPTTTPRHLSPTPTTTIAQPR